MNIIIDKCPEMVRKILDDIKEELVNDTGLDEIKRYFHRYYKEKDYSVYSNRLLLIYYDEIREYFEGFGVKVERLSNDEVESLYKNFIGLAVIELMRNVLYVGGIDNDNLFLPI